MDTCQSVKDLINDVIDNIIAFTLGYMLEDHDEGGYTLKEFR